MPKYSNWRCPRCGYTTDKAVMNREARLYYNELKPGIKDLIKKLFNICNRYVYNGRLNKQQRSKFMYTVGATKDVKDIVHGINIYMSDKMYKKGFTLDYLAAIIRNNAERKDITLKAEKRLRGIDPPEEE
tara:strand:+ start:26986 stop:27375 length:390 start_codon:yes stop_codon:yes gene_type:complete